MTIQLSFTKFEYNFLLKTNEKIYGKVYNSQQPKYLITLIQLSPNLNTKQLIKFAPTDNIIIQTYKCIIDDISTSIHDLTAFQCCWNDIKQKIDQLHFLGPLPVVNRSNSNQYEETLSCQLLYDKFKKFHGYMPYSNTSFNLTKESQQIISEKVSQSHLQKQKDDKHKFYKGPCKSILVFHKESQKIFIYLNQNTFSNELICFYVAFYCVKYLIKDRQCNGRIYEQYIPFSLFMIITIKLGLLLVSI